MATTSSEQREFLAKTFGARVNFDRVERTLYSHDLGVPPRLVQSITGRSIPEAIVQPESESDLIKLTRWATMNRVALTPRGKASAGYGGSIPTHKGVVVDFFRMQRILGIDRVAGTITIEPGINWERVEHALAGAGLALRMYPTSAPGSTVGGWVAQGGAGIGSYQYGWFREALVRVRVVTPSAETRVFEGDDLDLVYGAEGITGFITEVTVRVQPAMNIRVMAIAYATPTQLADAMQELVNRNLPVWSVTFINPTMARFKNAAPEFRFHYQRPERRTVLPEAYIVTLAYRADDEAAVTEHLAHLLGGNGGTRLSDEVAHHEWQNRFKLMTVKRLGPSLVPSEVVVPIDRLADAIEAISRKIEQPIVQEGIVIRAGLDGKPEAVLLGFIPADQRKFSYSFVFGLALSVVEIARSVGGRAYGTGMYFGSHVKSVMGTRATERIRAFKRAEDPDDVFNPGKIFNSRRTRAFMRIARLFEPLVRRLGNSVDTDVGERADGRPVRGIPSDIAWFAYACSQCGYCVDECDQFYGRGWESQSPRGKWFWLREYLEGREDWSQPMVDTFLACTTCEICDTRCSAALPIESSWMKLRGQLVDVEKRMTFPPFEVMSAAVKNQGNIWAGFRENRSAWFPKDLAARHGPGAKAKAVYFAGCTASYVENDIGIASVRLLDAAGVDFTYLGDKELCCATPMLVAGKWEQFVEVMRRNIANVKATGADTVISSCPACDMMWRQVYPNWATKLGMEYGVTAKHYSEIVGEKIADGGFAFPAQPNKPKVTVTWHDSCHIGRVSGVYEPPRELIKAVPNVELVEMAHNRDQARCCGSVLTLIKDPLVAHEIGDMRIQEAEATGAEKILALCPCCEFQLRTSIDKKGKSDRIEVTDLAHFCAESLGIELPDPHPEVRAQWAVFEAMIALMTPEGFATLMGDMFPELIAAMPLGMGPMMRAMGRVKLVRFMKPLFPVLFPRLLPRMMPKVMGRMLELIGDRVPMPDYMREQMPEIMPSVMANLMPHMLPNVIPLVSQPMVEYLEGR